MILVYKLNLFYATYVQLEEPSEPRRHSCPRRGEGWPWSPPIQQDPYFIIDNPDIRRRDVAMRKLILDCRRDIGCCYQYTEVAIKVLHTFHGIERHIRQAQCCAGFSQLVPHLPLYTFLDDPLER